MISNGRTHEEKYWSHCSGGGICAAIFWCGRIYSINHGYIDNTQVVEAGEAIECDGLVIRCVEAHIYSIDDYKTRFGVDNVETLSSEDRFVCACLNI